MKFMSEKKISELEKSFYDGYNFKPESLYSNQDTYQKGLEESVTLKQCYTGFNPTIVDANIFRINLQDIEQRIHVDYIKEYDTSVIYVDDLYMYPLAVRNFVEKTPHSNSRSFGDPHTYYPGLTSIQKNFVVNIQLQFLVEELIEKFLIDFYYKFQEDEKLYYKHWRNYSTLTLDSAIYSLRNVSVENSLATIHADSTSTNPLDFSTTTSVAGVIYLNIPSECEGGTTIYTKDYEDEIYSFDMRFNRLVLYPSHMIHSMTSSNSEHWNNYWRIIQRIFYRFESKQFMREMIKRTSQQDREENIK